MTGKIGAVIENQVEAARIRRSIQLLNQPVILLVCAWNFEGINRAVIG